MWLFIIGLLCCLTIPYGVIYAQHAVCGDGVCGTSEDCENCSQDCGICRTPGDDDISPGNDDTGNDTDDTDKPTDIEAQLQMEQLKIKQTSDFSLKGGAIDDLRILWP